MRKRPCTAGLRAGMGADQLRQAGAAQHDRASMASAPTNIGPSNLLVGAG